MLDIFSLKIAVRTSIIVHKDELWTNCTSEKSHMWFHYLVSVPLGIHNTTVEDLTICTSTEHYAFPNEYATINKWSVLSYVCGMKPGSTFTLDYCTMGIIVETESGLICN